MPLIEGIWSYTETETATPVSTLLNRLGDSVRTRIGQVQTGLTSVVNARDAAWQTYTPTVTNLTGFENTGRYKKVGTVVFVEVRLLRMIDIAGSVTEDPYFSLPPGMLPTSRYGIGDDGLLGVVHAYQRSTSMLWVGSVTRSGSSARLHGPNGTRFGPTNPFTWGASNSGSFLARLVYEVAP